MTGVGVGAIGGGVGESSQPPGNTALQPPQLQVQLTFTFMTAMLFFDAGDSSAVVAGDEVEGAVLIGANLIVFALLLSRKLGWNANPARIPVLVAAVLFAFALVCLSGVSAFKLGAKVAPKAQHEWLQGVKRVRRGPRPSR